MVGKSIWRKDNATRENALCFFLPVLDSIDIDEFAILYLLYDRSEAQQNKIFANQRSDWISDARQG